VERNGQEAGLDRDPKRLGRLKGISSRARQVFNRRELGVA